ncbi:MAG: YqgE/AlgH family protein [Ignavibacteriaceae bacterium]|nr:YqgE/AlgH family protein [Ignavibacteria bacterium]MCC6885037.1 YqgE/AlgH family protein [Ignavibacteriales bacterium]MEB2329458.1 YqgE/AlgH family protein [Ignavibacteriaceae bacterium]
MKDNILPENNRKPAKGTLLVSSPLIEDFFRRTVILITEHNDVGSVGFVLNAKLTVTLGEAIPELETMNSDLYLGGPVQRELLNFLHKIPDIIEGGYEVADGIYWGGNYEILKILADSGEIKNDDITFFLGYSGWAPGQLEDELALNTWYVTDAKAEDIFHKSPEVNLWRKVLKRMGGNFNIISSFPDDPSMN